MTTCSEPRAACSPSFPPAVACGRHSGRIVLVVIAITAANVSFGNVGSELHNNTQLSGTPVSLVEVAINVTAGKFRRQEQVE